MAPVEKRPLELIFVTQLIDAEDPVLGFVLGWIEALAARCRTVTVIANEVHQIPSDFPAEVFSLGKERGAGRVARALRYQKILLKISRSRSVDALVAHMCPVYITAAQPIVRPRAIKSVLWFAHPSTGLQLNAAEKFADDIVTSLPSAYPRPSPKVVPIGQAIDMTKYTFRLPRERQGAIQVVALGRTSPVKGYELIIHGVARARAAGVNIHLTIVGSATATFELVHREELLALIDAIPHGDSIHLVDGVAPDRVPAILAESDILINATMAGSGDKVVFEAMAAGTMVLVVNPAFLHLLSDLPLSLSIDAVDPTVLARRLKELKSLSTDEWIRVTKTLRTRVETSHSLDGWAGRLLDIIEKSG